jgi:hypothetical protein
MRRRLFIITLAVCTLMATASASLWLCTLFNKKTPLSTFLGTNRRIGFSPGFIYVNASRPMDDKTAAAVLKIQELDRAPAGRSMSRSRTSFSDVSGNRWLLVGWIEEYEAVTLGPYNAVFNQKLGCWISPWIGVLPLMLLIAWEAASKMIWRRRMRFIEKRLRAGQCHVCGYDLRASRDRCPECGAEVWVAR